MSTVDLVALRKPFDDGQIGKLPRGTCRACRDSREGHCDQHHKQKCGVCGNWMTTAHIHLDYVGHAQVTDRLLEVDPAWTWEPCGWTDEGLPAVRYENGGRAVLWIKLTVGEVTRLGVGIVSGSKPECEKELIGDALRNAAMRFGVALDLWAKGDLHGEDNEAPEPSPEREYDWPALGWDDEAAHHAARDAIREVARELPDEAKDELRSWLTEQGRRFPYSSEQMAEWGAKVAELSETPGRPFTEDEPKGEDG